MPHLIRSLLPLVLNAIPNENTICEINYPSGQNCQKISDFDAVMRGYKPGTVKIIERDADVQEFNIPVCAVVHADLMLQEFQYSKYY